MTEFAWNRDFLLVVFINPCQQIVRQMPGPFAEGQCLPQLGWYWWAWWFFLLGILGFLRKLLYASGGPAVQRIWAWSQPNDAGDGFFLKLFCFFFFGKWILKAKQMPLSPTGGPMGRSLETTSAGRILWGTVENLHAVLTSWHSNLGRSLRGQPFLFSDSCFTIVLYIQFYAFYSFFFLCSSWFWTFFYDFFFLKTVPALMCLCRVSRFDIKRSFLLPPCLVYFWVGPQLLDCCSNNARFRAQLQVRLPATAHKEKQYHNHAGDWARIQRVVFPSLYGFFMAVKIGWCYPESEVFSFELVALLEGKYCRELINAGWEGCRGNASFSMAAF